MRSLGTFEELIINLNPQYKTMENQLIKVISDSKVEQSTALSLQNAFLPFYDNLLSWSEKAKTLVVTDASQVREMKMAREGRLALRDIRIAANKKRIALKEDSTRYGKAVQNVYNLIDDLCTPAEKHLEEQEKFVEIQEENRKAELKAIRTAELAPYMEFSGCVIYSLGEYTEDEYQKILSDCKEALENKIAEEAQAELDRIAKEQEKVERQSRMFELGFKFVGGDFVYKGLHYRLWYIMNFSTEAFEAEFLDIIKRKEELDLRIEQVIAIHKQNIPVVTEINIPVFNNPPAITVLKSSPPCASYSKVNHSFHCFLCGTKLSEIGLGELECDDCLTAFIPFLDEVGNQCLASQK